MATSLKGNGIKAFRMGMGSPYLRMAAGIQASSLKEKEAVSEYARTKMDANMKANGLKT